MILIAITPTHERPEALRLCRLWMERQTRPPDRHIVVSRGHLRENILAADIGDADAIAVIEDDDYYNPRWLEFVEDSLSGADAVGQYHGHMYHIPAGVAARREHPGRAPLCSTAMRVDLWDTVRTIARTLRPNLGNIDVPFWESITHRPVVLTKAQLVISIKGMPSKRTYTNKHQSDKFRKMPCAWREEDPDRGILRQWVGEEAMELYRPFFEEIRCQH